MRRLELPALLSTGAGASLVALHYLLFGRFFPNASGRLGDDYSYFLPHLLDGFFWYRRNGPLAVPWFTPSFCAGMPKFSNPQSLYYSFPQIAAILTNPLAALKLTLLAFGAVGFWGFYRLGRRCFGMHRSTALLGATLFLFNGFYSSRLVIGHLTFHAFMLGPLLFSLLLGSPSPRSPDSRWRFAFDVVCAALLVAYVATTALPHLLLPLLLAAVAVALLRAVVDPGGFGARAFATRFAVSGGIALGICSAELVAVDSFLGHFPRTLYPLSGVATLGDLLALLDRALFLDVVRAFPGELVVNSDVHMGPVEFDYGIGVVPLALLQGSAAVILSRRSRPRLRPGQWAALLALLVLLVLPLALNYYTPGWNRFLKGLPILGNSTTNLRWFCIYIPVLILLAGVALERTPGLRRLRVPIAWLGIAITLYSSYGADRLYYEQQSYDPRPILASFEAARSGSWSPAITRVGVSRDRQGRETLSFYGNTSLVRGSTQLLCYEPLFGYRLEALPRGATREGSVFSEDAGFVNIRNPSCYLYPDENGCRAGDHFDAALRSEAVGFTTYAGFEFRTPLRQKAANALSLVSIAGVLLFLGTSVLRQIRRRGAASTGGAGPRP